MDARAAGQRMTELLNLASRPVAVPRIPSLGMRGSSMVNPGMSGVTRNAVMLVLSEPGEGARAITVKTCAIEALVM